MTAGVGEWESLESVSRDEFGSWHGVEHRPEFKDLAKRAALHGMSCNEVGSNHNVLLLW